MMRLGRDTSADRKACGTRQMPIARLEQRVRQLEGAMGRDQSLPTHFAGDRSSVQRRGAEHRGAVRLAATTARSPRSALRRATAQSAGTGRAEIASSRWSNSGRAFGPGRSVPAAKAAIRHRRISMTRRRAMPRATCAPSISIPTSLAATSSGRISRANASRRTGRWRGSGRREFPAHYRGGRRRRRC